MPIFFLAILDFTQDGFKSLEAICRGFLWGFTEDGHAKVPLIAWHKLTRQKREGGLGLLDFRDQAQVLKLCHVSTLLGGHQSEWTWMVRAAIQQGLRRGPLKRETRNWLVEEYLLLLPPIKICSRVTRGLLAGWKMVHDFLRFNTVNCQIPHWLTVGQLYCLLLQGAPFFLADYDAVCLYANSRGVFTTQDFIHRGAQHRVELFRSQDKILSRSGKSSISHPARMAETNM
jgi:hypothetical protein